MADLLDTQSEANEHDWSPRTALENRRQIEVRSAAGFTAIHSHRTPCWSAERRIWWDSFITR